MAIQQTWQYGEDGPGGGSVPFNVMRTGAIAPFNPMHVRRDVNERVVQAATSVPVGHRPGIAPGFMPPETTPAAPAAAMGIVLGSDQAGRPVRAFDMPFEQSVPAAKAAAGAFKRMAEIMRDQNLFNLAPPLVGGPAAALARGEAIVLRWPNGVAIQAAL